MTKKKSFITFTVGVLHIVTEKGTILPIRLIRYLGTHQTSMLYLIIFFVIEAMTK